MDPIKEQLERLRGSISDDLPFCSGVVPVAIDDLAIYYGKGGSAQYLNLFRPSASSLEHLVATCEPATFGRGDQNVYDESYRKAGKLGSDAFRPLLDINRIGLIDLIHERLLGGSREQKTIRAELYNINVYGEGSFFKPHVDTPRGETMFGSLVLFYPTAHEGGTLLMRRNGREWSFDSSKVLAEHEQPHLGYVALYSDVEHEVLPVTFGHRVSITYNLYFDHVPSSLPIPISSASAVDSFKSVLTELLDDPNFLPNGGCLGFGLEYAYPMHTSAGCNLKALENYLKGVDADTMQVFKELGFEPSLWAIVQYYCYVLACKGVVPEYQGKTFDDDWRLNNWLRRTFRARTLNSERRKPNMRIKWVKPLPKDRWEKQTFIGYGNEYTAEYGYHAVCLVVEVGEPGRRTDGSSIGEDEVSSGNEGSAEDLSEEERSELEEEEAQDYMNLMILNQSEGIL